MVFEAIHNVNPTFLLRLVEFVLFFILVVLDKLLVVARFFKSMGLFYMHATCQHS